VTELSMAHGNRPPETVHAKFVPFLCDSIQPYDEMFQFLSNVTRFLGFFLEITTNSNF